MIESYEILSLILCFVASAFFSGSEVVLLSIGIDRAHQMIEQGGRRGRALVFMTERPSELLTTILVGNNIANILAASLTTAITGRFFKDDAVGISVGITTFVILIFGEIVPKTFARHHAEKLSFAVISVLKGIYYILFPLIAGTVWFIHRILGESAQLRGRLVDKTDIEYLISKAEKEKSMDSKQIELISSILEFPAIKVKDIMVPRSQVKFLLKGMSFDQILKYVKEDNYSRYPVCEQDLEHTIGFLHVKDLAFVSSAQRESINIDSMVKAPFFVYEHMKINAVFDHMNRKKVHLALVKDETGIVLGIVTLEDIVEEILGEIQDEHDEEELNEENPDSLTDDGITVPGTMSLRDLYNDYDIKIPLNDNYSTIAGFILDMLGNNFPESGQIIVWDGLSFELENVDEYEIREIRIKAIDGEKHLFSRKDASDSRYAREKEEQENHRDSHVNAIDGHTNSIIHKI